MSDHLNKPQHWTTGCKIDPSGRVRYKCRYFCECGQKGSHYIPLGVQHVECHECGYHIYVQPAGKIVSGDIPKRHNNGYFFVAHARM